MALSGRLSACEAATPSQAAELPRTRTECLCTCTIPAAGESIFDVGKTLYRDSALEERYHPIPDAGQAECGALKGSACTGYASVDDSVSELEGTYSLCTTFTFAE